jgi:hypothetical protein
MPDETPTLSSVAAELYRQTVLHNVNGRHSEARKLIVEQLRGAQLAVIAEVERLGAPNETCARFLREIRARIEAGQ